MRNQRSSYDENRNFESRNRGQERAAYRGDNMKSRGKGEGNWQHQDDESGHLASEDSSHWRGGQHGQLVFNSANRVATARLSVTTAQVAASLVNRISMTKCSSRLTAALASTTRTSTISATNT